MTALRWKNQTNFFLGDIDSKLYEYKYVSEKNKLELVSEMKDKNNDQIFTIDY